MQTRLNSLAAPQAIRESNRGFPGDIQRPADRCPSASEYLARFGPRFLETNLTDRDRTPAACQFQKSGGINRSFQEDTWIRVLEWALANGALRDNGGRPSRAPALNQSIQSTDPSVPRGFRVCCILTGRTRFVAGRNPLLKVGTQRILGSMVKSSSHSLPIAPFKPSRTIISRVLFGTGIVRVATVQSSVPVQGPIVAFSITRRLSS